jgi:hypothetical protein
MRLEAETASSRRDTADKNRFARNTTISGKNGPLNFFDVSPAWKAAHPFLWRKLIFLWRESIWAYGGY